jgi:hypothetical protein
MTTHQVNWVLFGLIVVPALVPVAAAPVPVRTAPDTFLVENTGLVLLGRDGREKERLVPYATNGAFSPDGRNRKTVASRKYVVPENSSGRSGVLLFFQVLDWH